MNEIAISREALKPMGRNIDSSSQEKEWLFGAVISQIETVKLVLGFFSLSSIHCIFIWVNLSAGIANVVDYVFFTDIVFKFGVGSLFSLFLARIAYLLLRGVVGLVKYIAVKREHKIVIEEGMSGNFYMQKSSQIQSVAWYLTKRVLRKYHLLLNGLTILVFFFAFSFVYTGLSGFFWAFIALFILFYLVIFGFPDTVQPISRSQNFKEFLQFFTVNGKLRNSIVGIVFMVCGIFCALTGYFRYQHLISSDPVQVRSAGVNGDYLYIGKVADGKIFFDSRINEHLFIANDSGLQIISKQSQ